jgi:hypothetical protein
MSHTGGYATSFMAVIGLFVGIVNYYVYVMHFMHLLYFVRDFEKDGEKEISMFSDIQEKITTRLRSKRKSTAKKRKMKE